MKKKIRKKRVNGRGLWRWVLLTSSILTLTVILFALFIVPTMARGEPEVVVISPFTMRTVATEIKEEKKEDFHIDEEVYKGTLLIPTDDAGDSYLNDTLFIGDSNTLRLYMFKLIKIENVMGIEGMGIQSVINHPEIYWVNQTSPDTIPVAVTKTQPRRIVICFGTNNLINKNTKWFIENYSTVLDELKKAYQYSEIIIMAVPPIGQYCPDTSLSNKTVKEYNEGLLKLAQDKELRFLNTYEELVDRTTGAMKKNYIEGDGIHLTKSACEAVIKYFKTHASDLEDQRPKPLKEVAKRKEAPPRPVVEKPKFSAATSASYVANLLFNEGFKAKETPIKFKNAINSLGYSYADSDVKPGMELEIAKGIAANVLGSYSKGIIAIAGYYDEDTKLHYILVYFFASDTPEEPPEEPPEDPGGSDPGNPGGSDPGGSDPGDPGGSDPGGSDPGGDPGDPGGSDPGGDPVVVENPGEGG